MLREDLGIPAEGFHAFLNAGAAGIIQPDDRRSRLHCQIHDLADLPGVRFAQRAAEDGEVLRKCVDQATLNGSIAGNHSVAGNPLFLHPEILGLMHHQLIELLKGARVEEKFDALTSRELARRVLAVDTILTAAKLALAFSLLQLIKVLSAEC